MARFTVSDIRYGKQYDSILELMEKIANAVETDGKWRDIADAWKEIAEANFKDQMAEKVAILDGLDQVQYIRKVESGELKVSMIKAWYNKKWYVGRGSNFENCINDLLSQING